MARAVQRAEPAHAGLIQATAANRPRTGTIVREWPLARTAALTTKQYEGEVGNREHITQNGQGTLPIDVVRNMPGVKGERPGEHRNRQGQAWDDFLTDIQENGIREPIFITVDHDDVPRISEGNHRRDAAVELGLDEVPVEVRWFGHAEQQHKLGALTWTRDGDGYGWHASDGSVFLERGAPMYGGGTAWLVWIQVPDDEVIHEDYSVGWDTKRPSTFGYSHILRSAEDIGGSAGARFPGKYYAHVGDAGSLAEAKYRCAECGYAADIHLRNLREGSWPIPTDARVVEGVSVDELSRHATHHRSSDSTSIPHLVASPGGLAVLIDGNHALAAAKARGDRTTSVIVNTSRDALAQHILGTEPVMSEALRAQIGL